MLDSSFPILHKHQVSQHMMMKSAVILMTLSLGACSFSSASVTRDEMNIRASQLTKLSAAMESYVRYDNPASGMDEDDLLKAATKDQPQLLSDFSNFKLRVLSRDRHATILVCDKEGKRALLEDAGCTGKMDLRHWEKIDAPCSFTLSTEEVCRSR